MNKVVLITMSLGLVVGLALLPSGLFGSRRVVTPEARSEEQLTLVLSSSLPLGSYEVISTKLIGDMYHCTVKDIETFKLYLVDMGIGPPAPPETPGAQFTIRSEGTMEFDVKTEGIPPETTNLYIPQKGDAILEDLPDGDYEIVEVMHNGFASPDHRSTFYVYRLKNLNTQGRVLHRFIGLTGYLEKIGSRFHQKNLSNGGSVSEPLP